MVIKKIKELPISQKLLWGIVLLLIIFSAYLFFRLDWIWRTLEGSGYYLGDRFTKIEKDISDSQSLFQDLKEVVCKHDEKIYSDSFLPSSFRFKILRDCP